MSPLSATMFQQLAEESLGVTLDAELVVREIVDELVPSIASSDPKLLQKLRHPCVIDVRSESEFAHAHVPGAINLPLLNDAARVTVGTLYKQSGRQAAIDFGWKHIQPRLNELIAHAKTIVPREGAIVYCARGGLRSRSMAWLLAHAGLQVTTVSGGYKAIRQQVLATCDAPYPSLIVLSGNTGSGKTAVLKAMAFRGQQVLDLESLANHKGSAFGSLGEAPQPSNEHFENLVAGQLAHFDSSRPIWVEDESLRIGTCAVPKVLWGKMRLGPVLRLKIPADVRLPFSLAMYGQHSVPELKHAVSRVAKRLGGLRVNQMNAHLDAGEFTQAAAMMLDYYDQSYEHALAQRENAVVHEIFSDSTDAQLNAQLVLTRFQAFLTNSDLSPI